MATPARDIMGDPKLREEHALVVDDVATRMTGVCDCVSPDPEPHPVRRGNVVHLASSVTGRVGPGHGFCEVVGALHPTGAVGTVPPDPDLLTSMAAFETFDRGWYASPVGWTDGSRGRCMLALRCGLVRGRSVTLYAGAGLVAGSDPEAEWAETGWKLGLMEAALGNA